jgi:hypothetical protein
LAAECRVFLASAVDERFAVTGRKIMSTTERSSAVFPRPRRDVTERAERNDRLAANRGALVDQTTPLTAPSFVEDSGQPQRSFGRNTARRVDDIRRRYDPDGLFRGDVALGSTQALAPSA